MRSAGTGIRVCAFGMSALLSACNPTAPPAPKATPSASPVSERRSTALTPLPVEDWSTRDMSAFGGAGDYAATRAICAGVIHAEPPAADLPTAQEQAALSGCNSHALYYGIGMPADPVKARQCAMIERTVKRDGPFGFFEADGMLAMVYANGRGAARNYDVAIHMACRIDDAPAATDSRIRTLADHRRTRWTGNDFETCDDNTSGVGQGICADHGAQLAEQSRRDRIARLARAWTPAQRGLFDRAYASLSAYAETAHEMDCHGGTAHAACTIEGRDADIERFLGRVEALVQGKPMPADQPSEGAHPAIAGEDWNERYAVADEDEREWLTSNREQAVAARRIFERDLLAFAASALPRLTPHQVRAMFANI